MCDAKYAAPRVGRCWTADTKRPGVVLGHRLRFGLNVGLQLYAGHNVDIRERDL